MQITLTRPADWHLHLRDGALLGAVLPHSARQFARAMIMPNLPAPVVSVALAAAYRQRICAALPEAMAFEPLMTLYLTEQTTPDEIRRAFESGFVKAIKLYPAGATTHSNAGVRDLVHCDAALTEMEKCGLPLLVHGEVTDPAVDIFDREAVFIDTVLEPLLLRWPGLRVVFEHITTQEAAQFVASANENVAATITAQHLLYNRNALFRGGLRPHYYCLPVLKREKHRRALWQAISSGHPRFFLGTDSAPHARSNKEAACGCAGCFSAPAALELYAQAFEMAGALDKFEAFASFHGSDFYRLPRNISQVTLSKNAWQMPDSFACPEGECLIPLGAGETMSWKLLDEPVKDQS